MTVHRSIVSSGCGCERQDMVRFLISIDEALARISAHAAPVGRTETVSLESAAGRILAKPVRSRSMAPAFDNAAMDGYAIETSAVTGAGPWVLPVVARVAAGQEATTSIAGTVAARVFTGAPIPAGADAVVMQEDVLRDGDLIHLSRRPAPGLNIRLAGSDLAKGATVLDKGHRLGPRDIAACAAAGAGNVRVRRRLRVALLVTGDEVRRAGDTREASQKVYGEMLDRAERDLLVFAIAVAERITKRTGLLDRSVVVANAREAIRQIGLRTDLKARANPMDLDALRRYAAELSNELGAESHLELIEDPDIEPGGCIVSSPRPRRCTPTWCGRAAGVTCHNLDGWMMGREAVLATLARGAGDCDIALIEGVMGLFDGASPTAEAGSTAEIAKWTESPVAVVVDASGMARTIAALWHGVAGFDPDLRVAGLVCNRVGSEGHLDLLRRAAGTERVLGGLPKSPGGGFPERHLGLRTAEPNAIPETLLDHWGELASTWLDLDRIVALAGSAPPLPAAAAAPRAAPHRARIAIAVDEAFHFYYEDNLRQLELAGAKLVKFSPLRDATLPACDGLYIGGGYPELHAEALEANRSMRGAIRAFAERGAPVYAECGGLIYLARSLRAGDRDHAMVGVIDCDVACRDRLQALGYVEVETQAPTPLGPAGLRFRGHQFRYSEVIATAEGACGAYRVRRRRGGAITVEGYLAGNALGSYVHAHWASNPQVARGFVDACAAFARNTR